MGEEVKPHGVPIYTDARLYSTAGIPTVLYGAGPHTLLEANGHRADEKLKLDDLYKATRVVALALADLLTTLGNLGTTRGAKAERRQGVLHRIVVAGRQREVDRDPGQRALATSATSRGTSIAQVPTAAEEERHDPDRLRAPRRQRPRRLLPGSGWRCSR